ncbi:MAG: hypothetical protein AB7E79_14715 [Rhodospirillaceae bacterium]
MSRRAFVGGAGASVVLGPEVFAAAAPPEFVDTGTGFRLEYDGQGWIVDQRLFVGSPKARFNKKKQTMSLRSATYPGTSLRADFDAELFESGSVWMIRILFKSAQAPIEAPLSEWMISAVPRTGLAANIKEIRIGRSALRVPKTAPRPDFTIRGDFRVTLRQGQALGPVRFDTEGLLGLPIAVESAAFMPSAADDPRTTVTLEVAECVGLRVGEVGRDVRITADMWAPSFRVLAKGKGSKATAKIDICAPDGVIAVQSRGAGPAGARIQLEKPQFTADTDACRRDVQIVGEVARRAFGLETSGFSVMLQGSGERVDYRFTNTPLERITFRLPLIGASVPMSDAVTAVTADIMYPPTSCDIVVRDDFVEPRVRDDCATSIWIGESSQLDLPLESGDVRVRRSLDLFDLRFNFLHYALRVRGGETRIRQRWSHPVGCPVQKVGDHAAPRIIVRFPPQSILEEAFKPPSDTATTTKPDPTNHCYVPHERHEVSSALAKTRVAGPTRLVFEDKSAESAWTDRLFTVDFLTEWSDLAFIVNRRALSRKATLEDQLRLVGIDPKTSREDARVKIIQSIGTPAADESSIEAVYRMLMSPDAQAKWKSRRRLDPQSPEIWHTDLANPDETAMRVLYARDMDLGFLTGNGVSSLPSQLWASSLSADDRRQLAALTSFYGLAALRRLVQNASAGTWGDDPNGMVFMPPGKDFYEYLTKPDGTDVPQEAVMMPKPFSRARLSLSRSATLDAAWHGEPAAGYDNGLRPPFFKPSFTIERYLHRLREGRDVFVEVTYKGFLLPLGHRAALLKVTQREIHPAANTDKTDPVGYLIQHYYIVCRKPLKHYPAYNQPFRTHEFSPKSIELLTTQTPDLDDPRWPEGAFADPNPAEYKKDVCRPPPGPGGVVGVFWPVLLHVPGHTGTDQKGREVIFEYKVDGADTPARSPLLFVDNAAAHDPDVMKMVVQYYNDKIITSPDFSLLRPLAYPDTLRIMDHQGVPRRYAAETKAGECTFETTSWLMSVRGRVLPERGTATGGGPVPVHEVEDFRMDAFMEGKDQPPFYPVMSKAAVSIEPINRLIGDRQKMIEVAFNPTYVREGFDPGRNPSEIYLDLLAPIIHLDVAANGRSTGGVAKPNIALAALSRRNGPMGGRAGPPRPNPQNRSLPLARNVTSRKQLVLGGNHTRSASVQSAMAGSFDPMEAFGSALNEAKLLGIIPLKDILKVVAVGLAPKLKEKTQYLTGLADDTEAAFAKGLKAAGQAVRDFVQAEMTQLDDGLRKMAGGQSSAAEMYPELWTSFKAVVAAAHTAADLKENPPPSFVELFALADNINAAVRDAIAEVRKFAEDPMPGNLADAVQQIQVIWKSLRDVTSDPFAAFRTYFENFLGKQGVLTTVCDFAITAGLFEQIFGPAEVEGGPGGIDYFLELAPVDTSVSPNAAAARHEQWHAACRRFLRNPKDVMPRLERAVFYPTIGGPLARAVETLKALKADADKQVSVSRRQLAEKIVTVLRQGEAAVEAEALAFAGAAVSELIDAMLLGATSESPPNVEAVVKAIKGDLGKIVEKLKTDLAAATTKAAEREAEYRNAADAALAGTDANMYELYYKEVAKANVQALRIEAFTRLLNLMAKPDNLEKISTELERALRALVDQAVRDAQAAAVAFAKTQAEGFAKRITAVGQALVEHASASGFLAETADLINQLAGGCEAFSAKLLAFAAWITGGAVRDLQAAGQAVLRIDQKFTEFALTVEGLTQVPEGVRAGLSQAVSAAMTPVQRLGAVYEKLVRAHQAVVNHKPANVCIDAAAFLGPTAQALELRRALLDTTAAAVAALADIRRVIAQSPQLATAIVNAAVLDLASELIQLLDDVSIVRRLAATLTPPALAEAAAPFNTIVTEFDLNTNFAEELRVMREEAARLTDDLDSLKKNVAADVANIVLATDHMRRLTDFAAKQEKRLAAVILQASLAADGLVTEAKNRAADTLLAMGAALTRIHDDAIKVVTTLRDGIDKLPALQLVLSPKVKVGLNATLDALTVDRGLVDGLTADGKAKNFGRARDLMRAWRQGPPALVTALAFVESIVNAVATGNIRALIDVDAIERQLRAEIEKLIPAKISLTYDFDAELPGYPSGNEVFAISDRTSSPDGSGPLINDLVINTRIEIDVIKQTRTVSAEGRIRPFKVHLLGNSPDLVTILFKGAHFTAAPGKNPDFVADIERVEIGKALSFLSALASLTSGGGGNKAANGFYYEYRLLPPEVEVGYRFNKPYLVLGALVFQNIGFAVSAHLPFDNRNAEFRVSFATRERPLLISCGVWGGGGFVGIRADARGVLAFEIQLEYGAVVGVSFGPLDGSGRCCAGLYMLSYKGGGRRFEGFVNAVGEGHVACFGASFLLEVRTVQTERSSMQGSSTYGFSFDLGLTSYSYSVTAQYETQGGGNGARKMRPQGIARDSSRAAAASGGKIPSASGPVIRNNLPSKHHDWRAYATRVRIHRKA